MPLVVPIKVFPSTVFVLLIFTVLLFCADINVCPKEFCTNKENSAPDVDPDI